MSDFKNMAFFIGSGDERAKNAEAVEKFLQSKGYRSDEEWNKSHRGLSKFGYIVSYEDGDYCFHSRSGCAPLQSIPTQNPKQ